MPAPSQDPRYRALLHELKAVRVAAGVTQEELARRLGKRQQFVSKYEAGERRLDVIELMDVAAALAVNIDTLLRCASEVERV